MSILFIFSAPSGAGKTTLCREMIRRSPGLVRSISHTTRAPRQREIPGKDYYFISKEEFTEKIEEGFFLEWAVVHGQFYGTSRENLNQANSLGKDLVMVIDVQGAEKLQKLEVDAVYVFILAPSLQILEERLRHRGGVAEKEVRIRLTNAPEEMEMARKYDYILVNREFEATVNTMLAIVTAERSKAHRVFSQKEQIGLS